MWIGVSVAQGVLAAIGGQLFSALSNAIFGQSGKSIQDMLNEQLVAIAQIVEQKIAEAELAQAQANVIALAVLLREYQHTPSIGRQDFLLNESAVYLSQLASLGVVGYRTYMTAAGLRLSILQQFAGHSVGGAKNFEDQRIDAIAHHNNIIGAINTLTEPSTYFPTTMSAQWAVLGEGKIKRWVTVMGHQAGGQVRYVPSEAGDGSWRLGTVAESAGFSPYVLDWQALRTTIKAENTDWGEKMVSIWPKHNLESICRRHEMTIMTFVSPRERIVGIPNLVPLTAENDVLGDSRHVGFASTTPWYTDARSVRS
jgi:hypothetical protein